MSKKMLLIVDAQYDFILPGRPMSLRGVGGALNEIHRLLNHRSHEFDLIVATRDWHPKDHVSFESQGGEWPDHCVARSIGAHLDNVVQGYADVIVSKGTVREVEELSAWPQMKYWIDDLHSFDDIYVCGFALDVCVAKTVNDIVWDHYGHTHILQAATVPVNEQEGLAFLQSVSDDPSVVLS